MNLMDFGVLSLLSGSNIGVFKHLLGFSDAFEHDVALLVQPVHILHLLHFLLVYLVLIRNVIEFHQVFRKN